MLARGLLLGGCASLILLAAGGCDDAKKSTFVEESYPVRSDWLVVTTPSSSGQPSKWYDPGYPPLLMLDKPLDTLVGDSALLAAQARNRVILNTNDPRQIGPDVRDEFGKVLTELFGTPAEPRVPNGGVLIEQLNLEKKLANLHQALDAKKAEVATAKTNAKTPDDRQVIDVLEKQSQKIADDIQKAEQRIDQLRSYENDLKLDPKTLAEGGKLFRNYCQQCHGLTGDGNGPGGRYLIPLPRDYRQGLFKFITTNPSVGGKRKPRRDDLYRTITKGMSGSPMPQFGALKEPELQALVSYVIHLSMRGEAEYDVMRKAADPGGDGMDRDEVRKGLYEQAGSVIPLWAASANNPIVPPSNPYITEDQKAESAANGFKLFTSPQYGCTTCHINYGRGAPYQFDSWGSIVRPRNLTVATFRGGHKPEDIFARIYGGIQGSNMPSPENRDKDPNQIWDLVNFILYLSNGEKRQVLKDKFQIEIDQ